MSEFVKVEIIGGNSRKVQKYTVIDSFYEEYLNLCKYPVLLAKINNEIRELRQPVFEDSQVEFLDITDPHGFRAYRNGVVFMMVCAVKEILGIKTRVVVEHSINKNLYCEVPNVEITEEILDKVSKRMTEMVEEKLPIEKRALPVGEAMLLAEQFGLEDKVKILKYRRSINVSLYKLGWFYDYFYGPMVLDTGHLGSFKLSKTLSGFLMQFPDSNAPEELIKAKHLAKISQVFKESGDFTKILKVDTVGALNDGISGGELGNIIRISEALHEKKLANIADQIYQQNKTVVLIAGPSSSGKTTFAKRLCIQLRVNGLRPHVVSLDDYYLNRDEMPVDHHGQMDFECLEALDVKQINADLSRLCAGEEVNMPTFNFMSGRREYRGKKLQLGEGGVLVVEGIHGLNDALSLDVPKKDKFKIFISALTQLNIDDHNRIPTTDTRLIRRIVRDSQYRGATADKTIAMWPSVLRGENKYIFPFQENVDAFFNSALVYEMCVLKQFADPLLFAIGKERPEYPEARRLVNFFDSFLGATSEQVPLNSILREFIGGSCFNA